MKSVLSVLKDGKPHTFAELERKVNSNWETIRNHCKELEIFGIVTIDRKTSHLRNNKPYFEITITKVGIETLKKI